MSRFQETDSILSWGRVVRASHMAARPAWREELPGLLTEATSEGRSVLALGLGRSYGETGLNPDGAVIDMTGLDRIIAFDPESRILRAEAGLSLGAILEVIVPHGLFLPVTPGTRFVTLGGAVANDVHGKNHHAHGTLGRWVRGLSLLRSDGTRHVLGPDDKTGLFAASIGGLGLTGLIEWVEIELMPIASAMIDAETVPFDGLDGFFALSSESSEAFDYTVSWIDCLASGPALGRGLFSRGRHSPAGPLRAAMGGAGPSMPIDLPGFALNAASIRAFNALYLWNGRRRSGAARLPYTPFFYPLDAIGNWNRMYGRRGMYQYQSVVPPAVAADATRAMLQAIAEAGQGSFLAVLKTFGDKSSPGLMSFPQPGTTLALDFPNRGDETLRLLSRLDSIVAEAGGRLYPAKDGRIPSALFRSGYPDWERFAAHVDPHVSSLFWRRMGA